MLPLILAGLMAAQSLEQGKTARGQAKINNFTSKQNAILQNQQRQVDNVLAKTRGDLARYQQERSNKYKLINGAEAVSAQRTNLLRITDQAVAGSLDRRIQASEEAGALAAAAGAAGIGGGSVDMLNATNRLRQGRVEQMAEDQLSDVEYDSQKQMDQTLASTILGLDDITFNDNINYMEAQPSFQPVPSWTSIGMNAGMQFASAFNSMGGFKNVGNSLNSKMPSWLGGPSKGPTTQLK